MKKARIMLSVIAVFAVVGTALAFTTKSTGFYIFTKSGTTCPRLNTTKHLLAEQGTQYQDAFTSTNINANPATADCTNTITVVVE